MPITSEWPLSPKIVRGQGVGSLTRRRTPGPLVTTEKPWKSFSSQMKSDHRILIWEHCAGWSPKTCNKWIKLIHSQDIEQSSVITWWAKSKIRISAEACLDFQTTLYLFSVNQDEIKNMYFHAVKSTAHPPFIGALGHSTDYIVKQSYTFVFVQACCVLLEDTAFTNNTAH